MTTRWLQIAPTHRREARTKLSTRSEYMRAETLRRWLLREDRVKSEDVQSLVKGEIGVYEGVRFIHKTTGAQRITAGAYRQAGRLRSPHASNYPHYDHLRTRKGRRQAR